MGRLIYSMQISLDGYIQDEQGDFSFGEPADDVHSAANDDVHSSAAMLLGRSMYEVMDPYWTEAVTHDDLPAVQAEFARIWVATPRWVFSDTLDTVPDGCTLVRSSESHATVQRLKDELDGPLGIAGARFAASVVDLIDEFAPYVWPVTIGGGVPYWPTGSRLGLRIAGTRHFDSGVMQVRCVRAD